MTPTCNVLEIGRFESRCAVCGLPADPRQRLHISVPGLVEMTGCRVQWTHFRSTYTGALSEVHAMRPDLEPMT